MLWLEVLYLILAGKLPVSVLEPSQIPANVLPVLKAVEYLLAKGNAYPLKTTDAWKVASQRYQAGKESQVLLAEVAGYVEKPAILESVQQSLLLRRLVSEAAGQLVSGEFNLTELSKVLEVHQVSTAYTSLIKDVPVVNLAWQFQSGIPQLDACLGGFNSELIVVSARPKQGKSNLLQQLLTRNPSTTGLYITVADYGYDDLCRLFKLHEPTASKRKNLYIADFNSVGATLLDVEAAIQECNPKVVIVDRAEKLVPLRKKKELRWEVSEVFEGLRRLAKKYQIPIFTDSQLSAQGGEYGRSKDEISPEFMAEDKTGRLAVLDLFIGLRRRENSVNLYCFGRRPGLPQKIEIETDYLGRFVQK